VSDGGQNVGRRRLPREDDQPWYRQFWPWFLIALPGSVVVAALYTVSIAMRHADDLVVDDYYKTGLAINQQLEKQRVAEAAGMRAEIDILARRLQVRLAGVPFGEPLRLRLSHPLEADRDFNVQLNSAAPGLYLAELPADVAPNWHWTLDAGEDSPWRLDGSLEASDFLDQSGSDS
jgi:hypothetical protein